MANVHVDESVRTLFSSLLADDADRALCDADPWDECAAVCKALDARAAERVSGKLGAPRERFGNAPVHECAMDAASCSLWVDDATGLTVTAAARVLGGARNLTLGDVAMAADAMASAMGGEVLEFAVYENDGAAVCAYTVGFERDGEPCVGTVGFVPAADGTVNVLMTTYGTEDGAWAAPLLGELCATPQVAA